MNHCVPDWSVQDDSRHGLPPSANYFKSIWPEDELVELLWQNGHVVMQSQTQRKAMESSPSENKQCQKPESMVKNGPIKNAGNMVQEEASPWLLNYAMDADSFDKEFCQEFLCELPTAGTPEKDVTFSAGSVLEQSNVPPSAETVMPRQPGFVASIPQGTDIAGSAGDRSFTPFSSTTTGEPLNGNGDRSRWIRGEAGEASSTMAKESSICGSNQLHNFFFHNPSYTDTAKLALGRGMEEDVMDLGRPKGVQSPHYEDAPSRHSHERAQTDAREIPITSSSGGSGLTVGREGQPSANTRNQKRKGRDAEESELQSEEAEYESMETSRESQRSASGRRRATEVHNLSERRRRDRINEKMKALQELIPHCNKSDKASMLDEAIEYLKSLQMQVQMMWMRSGLAPMMFPGVHHYMPQMGVGMAHSSMPSIHGPIPFPRMPLVNQHVSPNPTANQASFYPPSNPPNFPIQMQHPHLPISYARCLGFQHMRPPPQMMNFFPYGAKLMQQSQAALGAGSSAPCAGDAPSENVRKDGNTGKEHT